MTDPDEQECHRYSRWDRDEDGQQNVILDLAVQREEVDEASHEDEKQEEEGVADI